MSWGEGRLDIIARDYHGAVIHKAYAGSWYPSITDWESLGGSIIGQPAMTAWSKNRLDMVVRGSDNVVYHKAWTGSSWYPSVTGWSSLGGAVSSSPSMVSWGPGRLDIVVAGSDTKIYHKAYQEGSGWYPNLKDWSSIGGYLLPGARPTLASWGPGRLDMFIRNSNFMIQHKAWDNQTGWYPGEILWEDIGKYIE